MRKEIHHPISQEAIEETLEAFELDWSPDKEYLLGFVERYSLRHSPAALCELVRIDVDRNYAVGRSVEWVEYRDAFPELLEKEQWLQWIAFEEFRARELRGLEVEASRWSEVAGIEGVEWYQKLVQASKKKSRPSPSLKNAALMSADDIEPQVGRRFGEFHLLSLLGTGAFSKVFLAVQPDLAGRYVALKVVKRPLDEPTHLARLQHTGIVPLYSLHRIGGYSVLCMPYYGSATMADWLKQQSKESVRNGQSLVETVEEAHRRLTDRDGHSDGVSTAVFPDDELESIRVWNATGSRPLAKLKSMDTHDFALWFAKKLAAALAHAHDRHVVHGDLKPANILFRNDGEPALIDFNLSHSLDEDPGAWIGGTLPYMSPEQLQCLLGRQMHCSATSDVFSLGIVLYQWIEGELPFAAPLSAAESDVVAAIEDRRKPFPMVSSRASAGLKAIVLKCLEWEQEKRYRNASALLEDLERESSFLPLKHAKEPVLPSRLIKFTKRYPRLFSAASVAFVAAIGLGSLSLAATSWWMRSKELQSLASVDDWRKKIPVHLASLMEVQASELPKVVETLHGSMLKSLDAKQLDLANSRTLQWLSPEEQSSVSKEIFDFCLTASFLVDEKSLPLDARSQAHVSQWIEMCRALPGLAAESKVLPKLGSLVEESKVLGHLSNSIMQLEDFASARPVESLLSIRHQLHRGRIPQGWESILEKDFAIAYRPMLWMTVGDLYKQSGDYRAAFLAYGQAIENAPQAALVYARRAALAMSMENWDIAERDLSQAIKLSMDDARFFAERARAREKLNRIEDAIADLDQAIRIDPESNRLYLMRSRLHQLGGNTQASREDYMRGIRQRPTSAENWISRALAQLPKWPEKALDDLFEAQRLEPERFEVLQNLAHVKSEYFKDSDGALEYLNRIIEQQPWNEVSRVDRCVLLARRGKVEETLADIRWLESEVRRLSPATMYQLACTHAQLISAREASREESLAYLAKAVSQGYGAELLEQDVDLDPLRSMKEFQAIKMSSQLAMDREETLPGNSSSTR